MVVEVLVDEPAPLLAAEPPEEGVDLALGLCGAALDHAVDEGGQPGALGLEVLGV